MFATKRLVSSVFNFAFHVVKPSSGWPTSAWRVTTASPLMASNGTRRAASRVAARALRRSATIARPLTKNSVIGLGKLGVVPVSGLTIAVLGVFNPMQSDDDADPDGVESAATLDGEIVRNVISNNNNNSHNNDVDDEEDNDRNGADDVADNKNDAVENESAAKDDTCTEEDEVSGDADPRDTAAEGESVEGGGAIDEGAGDAVNDQVNDKVNADARDEAGVVDEGGGDAVVEDDAETDADDKDDVGSDIISEDVDDVKMDDEALDQSDVVDEGGGDAVVEDDEETDTDDVIMGGSDEEVEDESDVVNKDGSDEEKDDLAEHTTSHEDDAVVAEDESDTDSDESDTDSEDTDSSSYDAEDEDDVNANSLNVNAHNDAGKRAGSDDPNVDDDVEKHLGEGRVFVSDSVNDNNNADSENDEEENASADESSEDSSYESSEDSAAESGGDARGPDPVGGGDNAGRNGAETRARATTRRVDDEYTDEDLELIYTGYGYFIGGLFISLVAAVTVARTPELWEMFPDIYVRSKGVAGAVVFVTASFAVFLLRYVRYKPDFGVKQVAWFAITGLTGAALGLIYQGVVKAFSAFFACLFFAYVTLYGFLDPYPEQHPVNTILATWLVWLVISVCTLTMPPRSSSRLFLYFYVYLTNGIMINTIYIFLDTGGMIFALKNRPSQFDPIQHASRLFVDFITLFVIFADVGSLDLLMDM